ncbi:type 1 glutamine amidotransferase [Saccharomonospora viridis]|uniref:GMP synthase family protein n=2 Tax=Saccharomonospora viridis TaxID=1852 RepID=C7MWF4_SACVD|nr:GMP synthase family protein [Saccharomonospora viridis DSM 43017]SFP71251.1 GMP synthase-Glutamine amidotransferase [Saccharomonospora viridis]
MSSRKLRCVSTSRLLVIQPDAADPPGPLGEWFVDAGAELDVRLMPDAGLPDTLDDYGGVVCLGGGMNAEEDTRHPWLAAVRSLLGKAVAADKPTLCVCLGAQLLAVAAGGRVTPGHDGPEVGPALVMKKDAAAGDPLWADLPLLPDVLQFHSDEIAQLPPGAVLLASSPRYPHQAFRIGRRVYGIQFHIETTPEVVLRWAATSKSKAEAIQRNAFDEETLIRLHADIAEAWRPFARRFVDLVAGRIEPAKSTPSSLPIING